MRKYKSLIRKSSALALAFAMAFSPIGVMAEDVPEQEAEMQILPETEEQGSPVENEEEATENAVEEKKITEEGKEEAKADTEEAVESGSEEAEAVSEENTDGEAVLLADGQYDVTAPVIEEVIFEQNGTTLTQDDEMKIAVRAYDADDEIASLTVELWFSDDDNSSSTWRQISLTQSETDEKLFEGSYPMSGIVFGRGEITSIKAVDRSKNYTMYPVRDEETNQAAYTFQIEPKSYDGIQVSDVTFAGVGDTLKTGDSREFSFKTDAEIPDEGSFYAVFSNTENEYEITESFSTWYGSDNGLYTGEIYIGTYGQSGKYTLKAICFSINGKDFEVQMEKTEEVWYQIEREETERPEDTEAPVITSVSLDKNGEILKPGDSVEIKVEAEDNIELNTEDATLCLTTVADIDNGYEYVPLEYRDGTFVGIFTVTEETYPCEWYISYISIRDTSWNWASSHWYRDSDAPYYFYVQNGNTMVNPTYDVTVSYYAMDENGYFQEITSQQNKNVERRQTFKEAGFQFPEVTVPEGLQLEGWSYYNELDSMFDENTMITSNGYFSLYAVYDKAPVSVEYHYLNQWGEYNWEYRKVFLDRDMLLKDAISEIKNYIPENRYEECDIKDWNVISSGGNEEQPIGNGCYIEVEAVYEQTPVEVSYGYANQWGSYSWDDKLLFVEKETSVKDVITEVKKYMPEYRYQERDITRWEVTSEIEDEEAPVGNSYFVQMRAVYGENDVPVQVRYSYLDSSEDFTSDYEMIFVEKDRLLKDVIAEVKAYRPENGYEGYEIEDWESSDEIGDEETVGYSCSLYLDAVYSKVPVKCYYHYYNKEGYNDGAAKLFFMEKGSLKKDAVAKIRNYVPEDGYEGLGISWELPEVSEEEYEEVLGNRWELWAEPKYEKLLVRFLVNDRYQTTDGQWEYEYDCDIVFSKAVSKGDIVELPTEAGNYEELQWTVNVSEEELAAGQIVVDEMRSIYGYGKKKDEPENPGEGEEKPDKPVEPEKPTEPGKPVDPEKPTEPGNPVEPEKPTEPGKPVEPEKPTEPGKPVEPEKPTEPGNPVEPEKPTEPGKPVEPERPTEPEKSEESENKLPQEAVETIAESIGNLGEGESYPIDMGNATVVPKEILQAAQGKNVDIKLRMNGYTWTINGMEIDAAKLQDINLEVKFNTNAVPSKIVEALAGGNPTQQISLTHEGDFGFKATLTMNAGAEYAGKEGNLYWYDSSHKMVFVDAGVIQPNGDISLTFTHASDYVLVKKDRENAGENPFIPGTEAPQVPGEQNPVSLPSGEAGSPAETQPTGTTPGQQTQSAVQKTSAKTGDTTSAAMLLALLAVSGSAAGAVIYRKRRSSR